MTASLAVAFPDAVDSATIVNSGSTNRAGWRIDVSAGGSASVPQKLAAVFFADVKAARDSRAVGGQCMKSASFGSSTVVTWHGWTSPDLDCPGDDKALEALGRDVDAIVSASGKAVGVPAPVPT